MPYICRECGWESLKWLGRCPQCGAWNSLTDKVPAAPPSGPPPQELCRIAGEKYSRLVLPLSEFNRVLGGGIVPGSLVLISGDPGIGKSTLLLQVGDALSRQGGRVVYASGEESVSQIKLRAERLGVKGEGLFLLSETNLEAVLQHMEGLSPALAIVDSIQTVYLPELGGVPGSLAQVRECTLRIMHWAKARSIPFLITGHVTKEGAIAGPRILEHIVDVVLYMEGEAYSSYRILRAVKNRFGSTNEVGVFEMRSRGLVEVANPSRAFLPEHSGEAVGCAVVPVLEGTRPLLVEIQALTTPTPFGTPRRLGNGVDLSRLLLVAAVLSRRAGLPLGSQDIMVNVVGGFRVEEPAADLGIALAIASCFKGVPVRPGLVAIGEIGLTGELRPVPQMERRLAEASRLGFHTCLVPPMELPSLPELRLVPADNLGQALRAALLPRRKEAEGPSPI